MSDPRFARLKTDPRFRKPRKKSNKVVVDDRFKSVFAKKDKTKGKGARVDKYGRKVSASHDSENLKRFYYLEEQEEESPTQNTLPDYARGEGLVESSDEENEHLDDSENDNEVVVLGREAREPIAVLDEEPEVNLDESQFAELDALAAVNAASASTDGMSVQEGERTHRLAVVNLDWDHVRASHLFKIFSSITSSPSSKKGATARVSKGKILSVRVYPSEFGKKRVALEQKEGPPKELFKKPDVDDEGDMPVEDDGAEYDEDALRKYQLERLRYYYAIVTCDTVDTATYIHSELDGTELERSANLLDLSFVPNGMTFDDEFRDEATQESAGYKGIDFVTNALRHSKVKLTWDDDDPERNKITRRALSRKEIEESDFKAYLASSGSSDEESDAGVSLAAKRDKIRALLLGDNDDNELLPEGWGQKTEKAGEMEITFTPGISGTKVTDNEGENETTLQRYLRKQKERRKKKKSKKTEEVDEGEKDEFFGEDSDEEELHVKLPSEKAKKVKSTPPKQVESIPAEPDFLTTSDNLSHEPKHFSMRSVLKAEKAKGKKWGKKKNKSGQDEDETQGDFTINVEDDRFKALHEDHAFAIDPTNPHFTNTKSMTALLAERAKRKQPELAPGRGASEPQKTDTGGQELKNLVESVKRKSAIIDGGNAKRRKL